MKTLLGPILRNSIAWSSLLFLCGPVSAAFISAPNRVDMVHDPSRNVLYISSGSSVLRYDLASTAFLTPVQLSGSLAGMDLSPDGNTLASASGHYTVRRWDMDTGAHWQMLEGHGDRVSAAAFSPDGKDAGVGFA